MNCNYNRINNLLGWLCGFIAMWVYFMTADRSTSWWDTGEFIASAYKLEIVHQPGAPLFLMIQNLFSNLALGNVQRIAFWMNVGSAVCSGLTITFLFWTITALARKAVGRQQAYPIFLAGAVGALAYSFTDTFWYSAVESEVYAMSSLCTAAVFWLALKWEHRADAPGADRWLLVIAYVMGLSIGVHLLNLLTIPAIALLVYFRKTKAVRWQGVIQSLGWGVLILALILWGIIQYSVRGAALFDLFFVNALGLPLGTGILVFVIGLLALLVYGIYFSVQRSKPIMNLVLLGFCLVVFGFSSYSLLPIRAQTTISLNNNAPDNVFSFLGYLSREQYQSEPLWKGPTYDAKVVDVEQERTYRKEDGGYVPFDRYAGYQYDKEMLFSRIYSDKHADYYRQYLGLSPDASPTFYDNLRFLFGYQLGHMYTRYFMWNFVGRQNDEQSHVGPTKGNWVSGIGFLDNLRLPGFREYKQLFDKEPSRNTYFFLPLALGIFGIFYQLRRRKRDLLIVGLLFFFTGVAIVLYLNQNPLQPRERDYAYAGSFYVFAIWIGLGVLGVFELLKRLPTSAAERLSKIGAFCLLAIPALLLLQNWDDHDRSDRKLTREMALNVLNSCAPNALLFSYADNDTFPLWYLQEVEGIRPDVRVLNYGYLQSDWYVQQAMQDINESAALPLGFSSDKVKKGVRDGIPVMDFGIAGYSDLGQIVQVMLSDDKRNMVQRTDGSYQNVMPNSKLELKIDKDRVLQHQDVPEQWQAHVSDYMRWDFPNHMVSRAELSFMSLLLHNNWERPIYFTSLSPSSTFMGMDRYFASEGLVYKLLPVELGQDDGVSSLVNTDRIHHHATKNFQWSGLQELGHLDTDSNVYFENWIYPQVYADGLRSLLQQGQMEKAKELAIAALAFQPTKGGSMRQRYSNTVVLDTLVEVGESERATSLAQKELHEIRKHMDYQLAITEQNGAVFDRLTVRLGMAALEIYEPILRKLGNEKLRLEATQLRNRYREVWL
ncbi:MAG: glycosyltransferase family 117 protein [Sphingobacteriaceae bacterium]